MVDMGYAGKYSPTGWKATIPVASEPIDLLAYAGDMIYQFKYDSVERAYVVGAGDVKKMSGVSVVIPDGGVFQTYLADFRQSQEYLTRYLYSAINYCHKINTLPDTRNYTWKSQLDPPTIMLSGTPNNILINKSLWGATYLCVYANEIAIHSVPAATDLIVCDYYANSQDTDTYTSENYRTKHGYTRNNYSNIENAGTSWTIVLTNPLENTYVRSGSYAGTALPISFNNNTRYLIRPLIKPLAVGTLHWKPQFGMEIGPNYYPLKTVPATSILIAGAPCHTSTAHTWTNKATIGPYSLWNFLIGYVSGLTQGVGATPDKQYMTTPATLFFNADTPTEFKLYYSDDTYFDIEIEPAANAPLQTWNIYIPGYGPGMVTTTDIRSFKNGVESDSANNIGGSISSTLATPIRSYANVATYYESATAVTTRTRVSILMSDGIIYADEEDIQSGVIPVSKIPFKVKYSDGTLGSLSLAFTNILDISSWGLFDYSIIKEGGMIAKDSDGYPLVI